MTTTPTTPASASQGAPAAAAGIDPGQTGAAVLLARPGLFAAIVAWERKGKQDRYIVQSVVRRPDGGLASDVRILPRRAGAIGLEIVRVFQLANVGPFRVACEDIFLGLNPKTAIHIAKWAGAVVAPVEELTNQTAAWVRADDWRGPILSLRHGTPRDVAKAASLRYLPTRVAGLADAMALIGAADHLTDAAGVAEWAATHDPAKLAAVVSRPRRPRAKLTADGAVTDVEPGPGAPPGPAKLARGARPPSASRPPRGGPRRR